MNDYDYHRPKTLDEAFEARRREPGARWLAGGTDLLVQLKQGRVACPSALISLRGVSELHGIEQDDGRLRIGALAPLHAIATHPLVKAHFPSLVTSIEVIGSRQIRNVASLGGNLCNASPGADAAPPLLTFDARVELRGPDGSRELALDEFFLGPGSTQLAEHEIMSAILLAIPAAGSRSVFLRKARVAMDIATVSVALMVEGDGQRIERAHAAAGAVAPVPLRLRAVEALLADSEPDAELLARAQAVAMEEIAPITDIRASAHYRRKLTGVLLRRSLETLYPAARRKALA